MEGKLCDQLAGITSIEHADLNPPSSQLNSGVGLGVGLGLGLGVGLGVGVGVGG